MTETEGPVDAYVATPAPTVAANYRLSVLAATAIGVVALAVLTALGSYAAGLLLCVGIGLGAYNARMVVHSAGRYAQAGAGEVPAPPRKRIIGGVFGRLMAITGIAVLFLVAVRPGGWGVVAGLAVFQLVLVATAVRTTMRAVRRP